MKSSAFGSPHRRSSPTTTTTRVQTNNPITSPVFPTSNVILPAPSTAPRHAEFDRLRREGGLSSSATKEEKKHLDYTIAMEETRRSRDTHVHLESQLAKERAHVERSQQELADIRSQLKNYQELHRNYNAACESVAEQSSVIDALRREYIAKSAECTQLQDKLDSITIEAVNLRRVHERQIMDLQERIRINQSDADDARKELESTLLDYRHMQKRLSQETEGHANISTNLAQQEVLMREARAALAILVEELSALSSVSPARNASGGDQTTSSSLTVQDMLEQGRTVVQSLRTQIQHMKAEVSSLQSSVLQTQQRTTLLADEKIQLESQMRSEKHQLELLRESISVVQVDRAKDLAQRDEENHALKTSLQLTKGSLIESEKERARLQVEINQIRTANDKSAECSRNQVEALQQEISQLRNEQEEINSVLNAKENLIRQMHSDMQSLRSQLAAVEKARSDAVRSLDDKQSATTREVDDVRTKLTNEITVMAEKHEREITLMRMEHAKTMSELRVEMEGLAMVSKTKLENALSAALKENDRMKQFMRNLSLSQVQVNNPHQQF